jgi:hypothetical protein
MKTERGTRMLVNIKNINTTAITEIKTANKIRLKSSKLAKRQVPRYSRKNKNIIACTGNTSQIVCFIKAKCSLGISKLNRNKNAVYQTTAIAKIS